jgi:hypothetical protein
VITLTRWHVRQLEWSTTLRAGTIRITGSRPLARALPTWNHRHRLFTPTSRPEARASAT